MADSKFEGPGLVPKRLAENNGALQRIMNGVPVPFFVLQEEMDQFKNSFQLYPDDVFVVTYPKSGTTWVQQIVRLLRNNGQPCEGLLEHAVPWIEGASTFGVDIDKLTRPRAFKSHMPYDLCPCGPPNTTPCKYIYVMRNPKDVAVSYHKYTKSFPIYPNEDWDTFWKKYIEGKMDYGDYFDHLLSWWPHRNDENVLFLKYEDMKKDLPAAVSQVASFIGADLSSDVIAKVATLTQFDVMKKDNTANYSQLKRMSPDIDFMRKGVIGDWKNYLTPEQSAQIDAMCSQRLKGTGLEFDYE